MASLGPKLALSVAVAGLTGTLLYPFYRDRVAAAEKVIDFHLTEPDDLERARSWTPELDLSEYDGVSALELEHPVFPPSAFVREPWRETLFVDNRGRAMPDPHVHYRHKPNLSTARAWDEHPDGRWVLVTNSLGLREDDEVLAEQPDLRILIAGDSHTDGVCNNDEAFGNLLEIRLRSERADQTIESLNAGRGGYGFYQYLGTLERFLYLKPDVLVVAVYGGNDFDNALKHFHDYNDSEQPPGSTLYRPLIDAVMAREELQPALAQGFASIKYFDTHPDQIEVASQVARDVTTEILVTCMRHSVHPIFVYIPSMAESDWDSAPEQFETLTKLLEVSPEGLASARRLGDSYLAYLREMRADVIDMREVFAREGPGNFWMRDHHINLRAQALIAEKLHPLVNAARPPGRQRARRAPIAGGPSDADDLLSPGSFVEGELERAAAEARSASFLGLAAFDEDLAVELFGQRPKTIHDELSGYRYAPNLMVSATQLGLQSRFPFATNSRGHRKDGELLEDPDLRVVIVGDDQASGACKNDETFSGLLEAELRRRHPQRAIETVNAAVNGHTFYNYVGTLEGALELDPHVLVVTVSSGNDFYEALRIDSRLSDRLFGRKENEYGEALDHAREQAPGAMAQSLESIKHFSKHRPKAHRAHEVAVNATREIERLCDRQGIELVLLHVPDAVTQERQRHSDVLDPLFESLNLDAPDLDINRRIADTYFREVERRGIDTIHLERAFAAADQQLYVPGDLLIGTAAHALIADLLVEHLDGLGLVE